MELSSRRASASQNPLVSSLWESLSRCSGSNLLKIDVLFSYKCFYYKGCHRLGLHLIDVPVFLIREPSQQLNLDIFDYV